MSASFTQFRPCIDLHHGRVKQIVGGSLSDDENGLIENFVSPFQAEHFATRFREDGLTGGHVIKLGLGNDEAAKLALQAYPAGLRLGGGVTLTNARQWLDFGAEKVIVTSWLFDETGQLQSRRLQQLVREIGAERLVIDLSCRRVGTSWKVAINRWQTTTDLDISLQTLEWLGEFASEFLIHAADAEGLCRGYDAELIELLAGWGKRPITYAGGITSLDDVQAINTLSRGTIDVTVGSALDIYGGTGVRYVDLLDWNRRMSKGQSVGVGRIDEDFGGSSCLN